MEQNLKRLGVRRHNDELSDTTVQSLSGFVRALLELLVVCCLLDDVQDGDGQVGVCQWVCLRVVSLLHPNETTTKSAPYALTSCQK